MLNFAGPCCKTGGIIGQISNSLAIAVAIYYPVQYRYPSLK